MDSLRNSLQETIVARTGGISWDNHMKLKDGKKGSNGLANQLWLVVYLPL
jgi:hypothetical protein